MNIENNQNLGGGLVMSELWEIIPRSDIIIIANVKNVVSPSILAYVTTEKRWVYKYQVI